MAMLAVLRQMLGRTAVQAALYVVVGGLAGTATALVVATAPAPAPPAVPVAEAQPETALLPLPPLELSVPKPESAAATATSEPLEAVGSVPPPTMPPVQLPTL